MSWMISWNMSIAMRSYALPRRRRRRDASSHAKKADAVSAWRRDPWEAENDRVDAPPLPPPRMSRPVRVLLVRHGEKEMERERGRHGDGGGDATAAPPPAPPTLPAPAGESTWNAAGRLQGSSDESVLTDKGRDQAQAAGALLHRAPVSRVVCSPLRRARETLALVRPGAAEREIVVLPSLREVDLYGLQAIEEGGGRGRRRKVGERG